MTMRKKIHSFYKHHSKATALWLTSIYSSSSSRILPVINSLSHEYIEKKHWCTSFSASFFIWACLALNLLTLYLSSGFPSLLGRKCKEKSQAQGTQRKGTSYSCFLGLQHAEKSTAQYRGPVTDSTDSLSQHEGFKARLLGIVYGCIFNCYTDVQALLEQQQNPSICLGNRKDTPNNLQCYFNYDTFCTDVQN